MFVPKTETGELVTRKDAPVILVEYENQEDLFVREEPTLRKMEVGKEGELDINFSSDMAFPDEWQSKLESDSDTLAQEEAGTANRRRRRL